MSFMWSTYSVLGVVFAEVGTELRLYAKNSHTTMRTMTLCVLLTLNIIQTLTLTHVDNKIKIIILS